jgi:alkylation response protein AidB-like acyl-CoA dehydrogenase
MLDTSYRTAYNDDHEAFRDTVRKVFAEHMTPYLDQHEEEGIVPRSAWKALGEAGMLCPTVKEENGGLGLDFGFNCVLCEELSYLGSSAGFTLQNDITANYIERLGTEEQRAKYLPGMVSGDVISAIAMTEPGAGSDLQGIRTTAIKDGNHLVVNGSKTYITNGQNADVVIVVAKTDPAQGAKGTSLVLVDAGTEGFERGRNLDKIGQHSADTSELFFNDVRVPMTNILGGEGRGFIHLMEELPQERLGIAVGAQGRSAARFRRSGQVHQGPQGLRQDGVRIPEHQIRPRRSQGEDPGRLGASRLGDQEAPRRRAHHRRGQRGQAVAYRPAMGSLRHGAQLHGGAGYMNEYAIARLWRDARVTRIFGGTNEIMKEVISRSI